MNDIQRWLPGTGLASCLLLAGLSVGCSDEDEDVCTDTVVTRADDDADFDSYETFAVFEIGSGDGAGGMGGSASIPDDVQVNIEEANQAASRELLRRGLKSVNPDQEDPDLWIVSLAKTEEEEGTYWACVPGPGWWGWYYYWDPCAWLEPINFEYTVGTLAVTLVDSKAEEPVFGGAAQGILECTNNLDERIGSAVAEIFDDYPSE